MIGSRWWTVLFVVTLAIIALDVIVAIVAGPGLGVEIALAILAAIWVGIAAYWRGVAVRAQARAWQRERVS